MKKLRIILAEDHALVRAGVRLLLERIPGVKVVGDTGSGKDAIELIRTTSPDIALLDLAMPELNWLRVAEVVTRDFPSVKVIILSVHGAVKFVRQALHAGARGYIVKDAASSELTDAIRAVANGRTYLSPAVSRLIIANSLERTGQPPTDKELTRRQRQVLRLLVEGGTMKQIAATLNISIKTVESHRAQLMERLKIHDVPGLVRYAMRAGLIPLEQPPRG